MDGNILTRRQFVVTTLSAAGGLAIGVAFPGAAGAASLRAEPWGKDEPAPHEVSAWLAIEPDGTVTFRCPHAEMGQGAATALPMIIAEELEADWSKIKVEWASANRNIRENGVYKDQSTVGSRGVQTSYKYLQQAGASARERLIAAAAKRWKVDAAACAAEHGKVTHKASGRTLGYGALAADAAQITLAQEPEIRAPKDFKLIGKSLPRLDTPFKINGTAKFGIDTRLPDMVYAAVVSCPVFGGKLKSVDATAIKNRRGIIQVVELDDAVAVAADRYWRAKEAVNALKPEWEIGPDGTTDSAQFAKTYRDLLDGPLTQAKNEGDTDAALAQGKVIEALYEAPHLAHAPMEPLNATVHLQADRLDVWIGTQSALEVLKGAAKLSGLPPEQVYIHNAYVGGGFGRRSGTDEIRHALAVAKAVGKPVKLVWTREHDIQHDRYRPQGAVRFRAVLGPDGKVAALDTKIAVASIIRSIGGNLPPTGIEPQSVDGVANIGYKIPNQRIGVNLHNTHVPVLFWRSVGGSQNVFYIESFIDELAHEAGQDPYQFRRAMLDRPDLLSVLDKIAEKSNWGKNLPAGWGRGIAICENHGSVVGQVAEISTDAKGQVRVERVVAAYDCGVAVNPQLIAAQLESGIIYGLSAALYGEITIRNGAVVQSNFDTYNVVRLADTPRIEVYSAISGTRPWGGIGEPGTAPLAPAVANAIFAATGKRLRTLPIMKQMQSGGA